MANFPFIAQYDTMDCGPTCLKMIAQHYGRSIPIQLIKEKTQLNKEGVSLLGIADAAEYLGFHTLGVNLNIESLLEEAPLPCILYWNQNHYVVLYKISSPIWSKLKGKKQTIHDDKIMHIADPAHGLIKYNLNELLSYWGTENEQSEKTGIALLLQTTPNFYEKDHNFELNKTSDKKYTLTNLFNFFLNYKQLIIQLLLGLLVSSSLQLLVPFLTQSIVDVGIESQNISFVSLILIAQFILILGRLCVEFIRSWILVYISTRLSLNILSDFFIKFMHLPMIFFDSKRYGDIMQRISDHSRIESFLTNQALSMLISIVNIGVFSLILYIYNKYIFIVFFSGSIAYLLWIRLFLQQRKKLDQKRFSTAAHNQSMIVQLVQGMQEIRLAGTEKTMRWAWEKLQATLFRLQMQSLKIQQIQQVGALALNESKNLIITFISARAVINGQLTLGSMLAIQYIVGQLNGPIDQFASFIQNLQDAQISLGRLNEIHVLDNEEPDDKKFITLNSSTASKDIHFNNVSFTYPGAGNTAVLDKIKFTIKAGQTTAIVGMSGSGKTTILKLILKFYDHQNGDIYIGKLPFRNISHTSLRKQCGVVMQDGFIFSDTIAKNIAVGSEEIDEEQLSKALYIANLEEFIDDLPLGIQTRIGAEGNGLSQGQRQRIFIARAVYKNPQFLLFDEATNSLDANNEAIIWDRLQSFFKNRTVVVVAHRLSTVSQADNIVVLSKGMIIEQGSHNSLIEKNGAYWELVRNQLELGN